MSLSWLFFFMTWKWSPPANQIRRVKRQGNLKGEAVFKRKCNIVNGSYYFSDVCVILGRNGRSYTMFRVQHGRRSGEGGWGVLELIKIMSGSASCLALASTPPCIAQRWRPFQLREWKRHRGKGQRLCLMPCGGHSSTWRCALQDMILL